MKKIFVILFLLIINSKTIVASCNEKNNNASTNYLSCGTIRDTLTAIIGCDSLIYMGITYFQDTIVSITYNLEPGCDSIVYTPIIINGPITIGEVIVACDSFEVRGNWYYTTQVIRDTFSSQATGCDSILNTTLLINLSDTIYHSPIYGCNAVFYNWETYYHDTLIETITVGGASNGCTLYEFQQINIDTINSGVSLSGLTITANQAGASYQWIDCNNGDSIITGETNQSYIASTNGSYAVVITKGSCVDTSVCVSITTTSINETEQSIRVYPNPSNGIYQLSGINTNTHVAVLNAVGQIIYQESIIGNIAINLSRFNNGFYLLKINQQHYTKTIKLVKK